MNTKIFLLLLCCSLSFCATQLTKDNKTISTDLVATNDLDFEFLRAWTKDKKILAIGESTHGLGEFFSYKSAMVEFLHKALGYEVLAIEGGFAEINLSWLDAENLTAKELRDQTVFGNFRCKEMMPLFDYIKAAQKMKNPLTYAGFDTQSSSDYYSNKIKSICNYLQLDIDLEEGMSGYYKMYQSAFDADSTSFIKNRELYKKTIRQVQNAILKDYDKLINAGQISAAELKFLFQHLKSQIKAVDFDFANKMSAENMYRGILLRDQLMFENIKWMIENLYPDKKIIIWAHNGHTQKSGVNNSSAKMMGQWLKEEYGDAYFSIGLFAYKGNVHQHWTGESIPFENSDPTFIESKMKRDNFKYTYQRFDSNGNLSEPNKWINEEMNAFEPENGNIVSFIPSERFDAAITIYSGDVPTFND